MFGTNLHPLTFSLIIAQIIALLLSLFFIISKKSKLGFKYTILSILCLFYNISNGLIPNRSFITDIRSQYYITFAIGILASCYSFYYIHYAHNIKIFSKGMVRGIITGFCGWYIVSFVCLYSITNDLSICRIIFFVYPIGISFYWFYKFRIWMVNSSYKTWSTYLKMKSYSGLIAIISLFTFPIVLIVFENNQPLERGIYNIGYISLSSFFFYQTLWIKRYGNKKVDFKFLDELNFNLTKRQKEIIIEIYKNPEKSYTDLSEKLNISRSTFTTHTTAIYKSLGVSNKSKKGLITFLDLKRANF